MSKSCVFAFVCVALAGCRFDPSVSTQQVITCSADHAECPAGRVCRTTVNLCVDPTDSTPPQIVGVSTSRTVLKRGDSLDVTLEVSEPLAALPVVKVQQNGHADVALVTSIDATHFIAHSLVSEFDEMGPAQVTVSLLDVQGNAANELLGPTVTYDFTGPLVIQQSTQVVLEPPASSLRSRVNALTVGGVATITIGFDELTASVSLMSNTTPLHCTELDKTGTSSTFSCVLGATSVEGEHELSVTAVDTVGNVQTSAIAKRLLVDTIEPPAPLVDDDGLISLTRVPWGDPDGGPRLSISAKPGSLESNSLTIIREGSLELARVAADDAGALEFSLSTSDRRKVTLVSVDEAGNQSIAADIKNVVLVASLRDKRVGDALSNPNLEEQRSTFERVFSQDDAVETTGPLSASGIAVWENVQTKASNIRLPLSYFYDSSRQRLVQLNTDTNSWNGRRWARTSGQLPAYMATTFDPLRGKGLAFGGFLNFVSKDELLEWNGHEWVRTQPASLRPPPRVGASLVYDPDHDVTLLFGGGDIVTFPCDMWSWNGVEWTQLAAHTPICQLMASSTYDSTHHRVLLWGGTNPNDEPVPELWQYDGTWQLLSADAGVSTVTGTIIHEPATDEVLLFDQRAIYVLDGGTWQQRLADAGPDTTQHRVVRSAPNTYLAVDPDAVWTFSDGGWAAQPNSIEGPELRLAPLAWSPTTHETLLFGGLDSSNTARNDLWSWNGVFWRKIQTLNTPPARTSYTFGYDLQRGAPVLFGGRVGDEPTGELWELVDAGWQNLPSNIAPRSHHAAAFAPEGMYVLGGRLADGGLTDEFWRWNGSWQQLDAGSPVGPIVSTSMTRNSKRNTLEMFGGDLADFSVLGRLWSYDGARWSLQPDTGDAPGARRHNPSLCFDSLRGETVMYGGNLAFDLPASVWRWNGDSWRRETFRQIEGGTARTMAFDEERQALMVYGPSQTMPTSGFKSAELWEYVIPTTERPGAVVKFDLSSIDPSATLESVTFEALATGSGWREGVSTEGVELLSLGAQTTSLATSAAQTLTWSGPPPRRVGRYVGFAVAPRGFNSPSKAATVTLDQAVLRVRYRLP